MAYLIQKDYNLTIQDVQLQQLISADPEIQATAEAWAQARIVSHLTQKYDIDREFRDTTTFDPLVSYKSDALVVYNLLLYYVTPPAKYFDFNRTYFAGNEVLYLDSVYTCKSTIKGVLPTDTGYWSTGVPYSVTAGTLPTDTSKWTKGDNRSQEVVQCMTDFAIFRIIQRISPRHMQKSRIDAYNESKQWLMDAAEGKITIDFPLRQLKQGFRIRFNSNPKNQNIY